LKENDLKYSEGNIGRIFVIKLEDGDKIPDCIEDFAKEKNIKSGTVFYIGGAGKGSKIVTGPEDGNVKKPIPIIKKLKDVNEACGIGTIFLNENNKPKLHMHSAFGRKNKTITGCVREGVNIWLIGEIIILEIINNNSIRKKNKTGLELLEP
jgi:predicted DNA-binding protein with PD1-like motif